MTPTVTIATTETTTPLPTTTPTVPPLPTNDEYFPAVMANEYKILAREKFNYAPNAFYVGYMLQDTSLDPRIYEVSPEICRVIFYLWDETTLSSERPTGKFVVTFPAQSAVKANTVFPVACGFVHWDRSPYGYGDPTLRPLVPDPLTSNQPEMIGINENLSDINANGLFEIAVWSYYCANACVDDDAYATHFYEIQNDGSITHITYNIPGEILPFTELSHNGEPGTLIVTDLNSLSKWERIRTWWIYKWDGSTFQDATFEYQDAILLWAQNRLETIREQYGIPITYSYPRMDFIEILLQLEKAGLQQEAIEIIQEITDPIHWPETDFHHQCWLRVLRDNAIEEFEASHPFSLPESTLLFGEHGYLGSYPDNCADIDR
ncbi:MAG: hypothetical protein GY943_31910 [Chloroflexi bacterium]|nr:hypothetical protein [Chloroflexota bacterium]